MKLCILTLAFFIQICYGYSQSKPPIAPNQGKVAVYQGVDSALRAENQFYKLKEDYYSDALSDQASRFSSIVSVQSTIFSGVVGLIGVILGFQLFSFRRKLETDIGALSRQVHTIEEEAKEKNDYALYRIYRSYSETLLTQADSNISIIGAYTVGLWQCIQSFETLALSYQYSQTDQYRAAVDRYVNRALELANGAIMSINMKIDADNDEPTDGLIVVELNLDQLSYGRSEFMTDFMTLFSKQVINTFMTQLIQASGDASLTEKLFTLRAKIDQASAKCGTSIPDKPTM